MDPSVQVAMDQTLQALQALYNHLDPATTKQADDWLTQFQQSPLAWRVSHEILNNPETPHAAKIFAAQTMRTKVQFDFYELPADSYLDLRNSLLTHIERFGDGTAENQPIHTMLAITLADLAIQMDSAWPNAVESLFQRFGQVPERYPTLLEIVKMLPEENMNYKLMTDTAKRDASANRLKDATADVITFLLGLNCPTVQAKKKVLECFLSWIKFTSLQGNEIANNPLIPDCFRQVAEGTELSETATDIIIEILRMSSQDITFFQPLIQGVLSMMPSLQSKFESILARGADAACMGAEQNSILQICRIYVETGECLVPLIMSESTNPQVLQILHVILRCTDLPDREIGQIPLDFWHRLADDVCRHPETDAKIDQFKGIYVELLGVVIRRCQVPANEDPFAADDDFMSYRGSLLNLAQNCLEILTPNTALEHVLKSLLENHKQNIAVQEAHFYCLTKVGERAEVREGSVLWQLIQSLPPLISQQVQEESSEAAMLHYTKKTAIELLGHLSKWVKAKPEFLRCSLEMISQLLLQPAPQGAPPQILERTKQVQQAASMSFKDICVVGQKLLQDAVNDLLNLYVATMALPIRMHLFIVEGVATIVVKQHDETFQNGMEKLVVPLVQGLNSEREKPHVLSEILDRLQMIIRLVNVHPGSSKAVSVGSLISNHFWPLIMQTLQTHPSDGKVVEKSCRLLKHSMRCVPDLFKPNVPAVAATLTQAFQAHQHSSYLYSAEILANTYAHDPEIVPVLTQLFHSLSSTGLQCLVRDRDKLEEITELVEDFYGMFERYLRYAPTIVLEAPTLPHTLQLWQVVIFVQQKDAIEAVIAFIEKVLEMCRCVPSRFCDEKIANQGQILRGHVMPVCPGFVEAIFKLISSVPTRYVQEALPCVLEEVKSVFPQEFPTWLEAGLMVLPPSAVSQAEKQNLGKQILRDEASCQDAVSDLCYRCEQVRLRSRGKK